MNDMSLQSMQNNISQPEQITIHGIKINKNLAQGPFIIDDCDTITKLFLKRCKQLKNKTAHREKDLGIWKSYSWNDYYEHARLIALGLISLGLQRGDVISILSEDRKEWMYADIGVQCVGGIVSGVYTTDSASQLSYLINDSDSQFLFLEDDEQLDKYLSVRETMPGLKKVIVFEEEGLHNFHDENVIFIDELYAIGRNFLSDHPELFDTEISNTKPGDICVLVYTSGTTGAPKGAMYSHENVMASTSIFQRIIPLKKGEEKVCFLPLCHVVERIWSTFNSIVTSGVVNFAESPETVFDNIREISPYRMFGVPRIWEKLYSSIMIMEKDATKLGQFFYRKAQAAGLRHANAVLDNKREGFLDWLSYRFWDFTVLKNIRTMLGMSKVRSALSGAAPISPEILKWFRSLGIPVFEGYGMTETTGIISINTPLANKVGTVGKVVPGVSLRISDEGEIQVTGANIFSGYWKKEEKTRETFTDDGWLKTGDVGEIDSYGFLKITGRMKDIIITAGGKNITPSELENKLKASPYILDAVIIGDRRKYLTTLIMIEQENIEKFAQDQKVPFSDYASLCAAKEVVNLIREIVDDVNKDFARVEQVKDFRIIDVLLTAEDDELTSTMKLKRSFVEEKYKPLIDSMY